jgi:7-cyano-7-deazaguanine synthase
MEINSSLHVDKKPYVVVLLSGGLDSITLATKALSEGRLAFCVVCRYGQPHCEAEVHAATMWCRNNNVVRVLCDIELDGRRMSWGAGRPGPRELPGRNLMMLANAIQLSLASNNKKVTEIWYGPTLDDRKDYMDCGPEFVESVNRMAQLYGISVLAPFIDMPKREVVSLARDLKVDINATWSCYEPVWKSWEPTPCGGCNACILRDSALK